MNGLVTIELDGNRIAAHFDYDPMMVRAIKCVPGSSFRKSDKAWTLPLDIQTCHALRDVFGDNLIIGDDLRDWAWDEVRGQRELSDLASADDADLNILPNVLPELADALYDYQRAGVAFIAASDAPLVADQPGLGKTLQVIAGIAESGLLEGEHLIVAPKTSLDTVWRREIDKWGKGEVYTCDGSRSKRNKTIEAFFASDAKVKWLVVNPAMVRMKKKRTGGGTSSKVEQTVLTPSYPELIAHEWTTVTVDECHDNGTRNPKTMTAKGMYKLKAIKAFAISGTPMTNHPIDLWGTLHFLHPDKFTSKWRWAETWMDVSHNGFGMEIGGIKEDRVNEFFKSLAPYVLRRTKDEVLTDLPPKTHIDVWCDMTPKQRKLYKQFAKDAQARIADFSVAATNILAEMTRLKQFSNSYVEVLGTNKDNQPILAPVWEESGKRDHLYEILAERGIMTKSRGWTADETWTADDEKVIIFSQFTKLVDAIVEDLQSMGVAAEALTGATSQEERQDLQERFQSDGGPQVIVMNVRAGGTAITLDRASTVVFMDETWSPADKEQAEDRAHRASRIHNVTIYTLRSKGTLEETIMARLDGKRSAHQFILDERRTLQLWTDDA